MRQLSRWSGGRNGGTCPAGRAGGTRRAIAALRAAGGIAGTADALVFGRGSGPATPAAGDWLSGRALPSHGRGHWFEPSIAHELARAAGRRRAPPAPWAAVFSRGPSPRNPRGLAHAAGRRWSGCAGSCRLRRCRSCRPRRRPTAVRCSPAARRAPLRRAERKPACVLLRLIFGAHGGGQELAEPLAGLGPRRPGSGSSIPGPASRRVAPGRHRRSATSR